MTQLPYEVVADTVVEVEDETVLATTHALVKSEAPLHALADTVAEVKA